MPVEPLKQPTAEELQNLRSWMTAFKDSGCRILVPNHYASSAPILTDLINGHLLIAPSGIQYTRLGFQFENEHRARSDTPLPSIIEGVDCLSVHLMGNPRHENFFIYRTPEERDGRDSLVNASRGMYQVELDWFLAMGAVIRH